MSIEIFQVGVKALIRNPEGKILMLHIPEWSANPAHWDLPGGRLDQGEGLIEALKRELKEELSVNYLTQPEQLITTLTKMTIPSQDGKRLPLLYVVYQVEIEPGQEIHLDPESNEDEMRWFDAESAAEAMKVKFDQQFCQLIKSL